MSAPPIFRRAPRIYPEMPQGEVEIPAPPPPPPAPLGNAATTLLPRLSAVGGLGASVAMAGMGQLGLAALSFGFAGFSSAAALIGFFSQKKNYERALKERDGRYRALLDARREELTAMRERQLAALRETDPPPDDLLRRVENLDRQMWQRSPSDPDFLSVRIGVGAVPSAVRVKPPRVDHALATDALIEGAQSLAAEFSQVHSAPITLPLHSVGAAGIAGARPLVLETVRALAMGLAAHHSPDELKICALFPSDEEDSWSWLRWLPHTWTDDHSHRFLASERDSAARLSESLYRLLSRRKGQQGQGAMRDPHAHQFTPHFVFFLADPRLAEGHPLLRLLLREGKSVGAHPICLASAINGLPKECRAIVELRPDGSQLIQTAPAPSQAAFTPDKLDENGQSAGGDSSQPSLLAPLPERMARQMAPIRLRGMASSTEIPDIVPLMGLLGVGSVEDLDVAARWRGNSAFGSLAVPIGRRAGDEPLWLDLSDGERAHGPHGLVAGTTGAGKSELLQSLVASLATHFHPHQLNFVLVDYKGGGMANAFEGLPHLAGVITNLQGNGAMRALSAIKAEVQRRQALLAKAGVDHIDKYGRLQMRQAADEARKTLGDGAGAQQSKTQNLPSNEVKGPKPKIENPVPHLVLIVDEFAELATEQPDFMKQLVSTVRVGRSLGVHLILATQKPAGVVSDQIWSNTNFRICLRVQQPEDSREVLKRPDAASLTQPGRAYFQVGNNQIFELFQSAWGGAAYVPGSAAPSDEEEIVEVGLDGARHPLRLMPKPVIIHAPSGTQLQALVSHLRDVAASEGVVPLPGPWLPPLPESVALDELLPKGVGWDGIDWRSGSPWMEPVVGLVDDPARQHQGPLAIPLAREGHLAVYGAPGTGKSTFVQTLVLSLAHLHSPQDVHFYLLDFGGRALSSLAGLPHVGGVVSPDEGERLHRLFRLLLREMEARKAKFARAGVNTLAAYRQATGEPLPALVVALDGFTGFVGSYPDLEDPLSVVAREGGNLGMHLVLTVNSPSALKAKIAGNITAAVALQMADRADYGVVMGRIGVGEPEPVPGRALLKGNPTLEFQTALSSGDGTEAGRSAAVRRLTNGMAEAWAGPRARPIPELPPVVALSELLPPSPGWPPLADLTLSAPLGLDMEELEPFLVDVAEGPHFVVTGPIGSGKTTLLQTWLLALAERYPPQRLALYLVDFRRSGLLPLQRLPQVRAQAWDEEKLNAALDEITRELAARRKVLEGAREGDDVLDERVFLSRYPALVLAIDDFDALRDGAQAATKTRLETLIRRERGLGFHVLLAGAASDLAQSYEGTVKALKEGQSGFVLGTGDAPDLAVVGLRLPYNEAAQPLAPGEGYYARRGRGRKVKIATAQVGALGLREWVGRIVGRTT